MVCLPSAVAVKEFGFPLIYIFLYQYEECFDILNKRNKNNKALGSDVLLLNFTKGSYQYLEMCSCCILGNFL